MSSVHPKRAPRGQARLELVSRKEKIAEVASKCPNLKEVWKSLRQEGVITIAYPTFCNAYRDVFARDEPSSAGSNGMAESAPARAEKPNGAPGTTETTGIGSFNHNPRNDEVRSRW